MNELSKLQDEIKTPLGKQILLMAYSFSNEREDFLQEYGKYFDTFKHPMDDSICGKDHLNILLTFKKIDTIFRVFKKFDLFSKQS